MCMQALQRRWRLSLGAFIIDDYYLFPDSASYTLNAVYIVPAPLKLLVKRYIKYVKSITKPPIPINIIPERFGLLFLSLGFDIKIPPPIEQKQHPAMIAATNLTNAIL